MTFAYDFGDGWTFPIRLEEIIDDKVYEEASPLILNGEGLGIIEDVGVLDQCRTVLRRLKRNQVKITLNGWG
ncbi:hypothetical protein [uncultured Treponema sp.]|uniref:IS1096 element passenger TnpR family protein n=1 Tax=uncultured Treponema sp. TaxID=162155 RepID=UPI00338DF5F7